MFSMRAKAPVVTVNCLPVQRPPPPTPPPPTPIEKQTKCHLHYYLAPSFEQGEVVCGNLLTLEECKSISTVKRIKFRTETVTDWPAGCYRTTTNSNKTFMYYNKAPSQSKCREKAVCHCKPRKSYSVFCHILSR